jgi:hypothetical protein
MANIPITMDQLAKMINEGFKITATKADVAALRSEINEKLDAVESRLGRIEHLFVEDQRRQTEHLETRMKKLEDALAVEQKRMRPGQVCHPAVDGPGGQQDSWTTSCG